MNLELDWQYKIVESNNYTNFHFSYAAKLEGYIQAKENVEKILRISFNIDKYYPLSDDLISQITSTLRYATSTYFYWSEVKKDEVFYKESIYQIVNNYLFNFALFENDKAMELYKSSINIMVEKLLVALNDNLLPKPIKWAIHTNHDCYVEYIKCLNDFLKGIGEWDKDFQYVVYLVPEEKGREMIYVMEQAPFAKCYEDFIDLYHFFCYENNEIRGNLIKGSEKLIWDNIELWKKIAKENKFYIYEN